MEIDTGDVRAFGQMRHGILQRLGLLVSADAVGQSAFRQISVTKNSNIGSRAIPFFAMANQAGYQYFWIELSSTEGRDVVALALSISEGSSEYGTFALHGISIEVGPAQGAMLLPTANRIV